jgi:soluble cytochrome b562
VIFATAAVQSPRQAIRARPEPEGRFSGNEILLFLNHTRLQTGATAAWQNSGSLTTEQAMSLSSISAATYPTAAQYTNWKNGMDQLVQAVQAGNLTAAQQAYAALSQQLSSGAGSAGNGQGTPLTQALDQIGTALQSGNIGGAQQALPALQQQAQARPHHHHNHGGGTAVASNANTGGASSSAPSTDVAAAAATSAPGIDVTA